MTITADLAKFGYHEKIKAAELLTALRDQGLPRTFHEEDITMMLDQSSGRVFLLNSEYEIAMVQDGKLEQFYNTPCDGVGFIEKLLGFDPSDIEDNKND